MEQQVLSDSSEDITYNVSTSEDINMDDISADEDAIYSRKLEAETSYKMVESSGESCETSLKKGKQGSGKVSKPRSAANKKVPKPQAAPNKKVSKPQAAPNKKVSKPSKAAPKKKASKPPQNDNEDEIQLTAKEKKDTLPSIIQLTSEILKDHALTTGGQVIVSEQVLQTLRMHYPKSSNVNCRVETFGKVVSAFCPTKKKWMKEMGFGSLSFLVDRGKPRELSLVEKTYMSSASIF